MLKQFFFGEGINKTKEIVILKELQAFEKCLSLRDPLGSSVNYDVANKPYLINIYIYIYLLLTYSMVQSPS